ncbi:MAG TPA: response regulator [Burkholderiales bacterium]|jgi:DNA-binding response OmpR family regulator
MATLHRLKPTSPTPKRRILVVEDDLDSVHSMAMLIKMMGHEVQFAINGMAAIDIARTFRPDIIMLDIGLPDFEGDQIARQLRYEPGLESAHLIAISGLPEEHLESRALRAGCAEFYRKPIEPAMLEALLARPLDGDQASERKPPAASA